MDVGYPAEQFDVPAMVGDPNPGCFAFRAEITADCAGSPIDSTAITPQQSTSANYPFWGHLLPGLASFIPSPYWYLYLARMLNSAVAAALLVASLVRCRRATSPWLAVGLFAGLTPIGWFAVSMVSPSALAIAGGAALWVSVLTAADSEGDGLLVAGWLAVVLPRRDGPLWATLIVIFACLAVERLPSALWRQLGRGGKAAVAVAVPLSLLPTFINGFDRLNTALAFVPLALPLGELVVITAQRRKAFRLHPAVIALSAVAVAVAAVLAANLVRPGGADAATTGRIIANTGRHLRQIVGVLGWLDTPTPELAVLVWWVAIGGLASLALLAAPRAVAAAAGVLGTAIVTAWVLELGTGDTTGTYWQGRYSMPFVLGMPILLARGIGVDAIGRRRVTNAVLGAVWMVWNAAFFSAIRRWGAGVDGSVFPWRWSTWHSPGPPALFIVAHALASGWLLLRSVGRVDTDILGAS